MLKNILSCGPRQCGTVVVEAGSARRPAGSKPSPPRVPNVRLCRASRVPRYGPLPSSRGLRPRHYFLLLLYQQLFLLNRIILSTRKHLLKKRRRKQKTSPLVAHCSSLLRLKVTVRKNCPSASPRPHPGTPRTHSVDAALVQVAGRALQLHRRLPSLSLSLSVGVTRVLVPCVSVTPRRLSSLLPSSRPSP